MSRYGGADRDKTKRGTRRFRPHPIIGRYKGIKHLVWRKDQAWEVVRDPLPWLLFLMIFCQTLVVGGLNTFNSLLINKAFGFNVSVSQLLGLPLAVFQGMLYILIG